VKHHGMDDNKAIQYAGLFSELTQTAREFLQKRLYQGQTEEDSELRTLRLRTRKNEFIITPGECEHTDALIHIRHVHIRY
jgi:hypothetical protein